MPLVFLTPGTCWSPAPACAGGETVLIHAAGSGVGSAAIQIARLHPRPGDRNGLIGRQARQGPEIGADETVTTRRRTGRGGPPDHGEARRGRGLRARSARTTWDGSRSPACWRRAGRLVTCGATSGNEVDTRPAKAVLQGLSVLGSTMGNRTDLLQVMAHAAAGRLRPVVDRVDAAVVRARGTPADRPARAVREDHPDTGLDRSRRGPPVIVAGGQAGGAGRRPDAGQRVKTRTLR